MSIFTNAPDKEARKDGRDPGKYPVLWLQNTFSSPSHTAELLRPEVEDGTITPADYRLAQEFFPASFRWVKFGGGIAGSLVVAAYATTRKPQWAFGRTSVATTVAYLLGSMFGTYQEANAHIRFQVALEDPSGLERAMEHVNSRQGNRVPLNISFHWAHKNRGQLVDAQPVRTSPSVASVAQDGWSEAAAPSDATPPPLASTSAPNPVTEALRSTTRWDDIRKANAGGAQQSSWEKLRQEKERPGPSTGSSSQAPAESFPSYSDDDRTRQQAEFDALVEAERRLGSQDSNTRFDGAVSS